MKQTRFDTLFVAFDLCMLSVGNTTRINACEKNCNKNCKKHGHLQYFIHHNQTVYFHYTSLQTNYITGHIYCNVTTYEIQ